MIDVSDFYEEITRYFQQRFPDKELPSLNTNLWDEGLVDSFAMVELVIFLEDYLGCEIELAASNVRMFHTIQRIYDAFVKSNRKSIKDGV
jgi:acyl carrier protein